MNRQVRNILLRLSLLLGLGAFVALMVFAKVNRERTTVTGIEVRVDDLREKYLVRQADILELVNSKFNYRDKVMTGRVLRRIEQQIEALPQVSRAKAFVDENHRLCIEVEQRLPVARVYALSGESYYLDAAGNKFPLSPVNTVKVPVITGNIAESCKKVEPVKTPALAAAFRVQQGLAQDPQWTALVGEIHVNEKSEIELLTRLGDAVVLLGTPDNLEFKMKKLMVFYAEALGKTGWDKYKVINIMYKDQIICLK